MHNPPTGWMMLPVTEFEYLKDEIRRLTAIIDSHRDKTVPSGVSGSEVFWICRLELEDLRESLEAYRKRDQVKEKRLEARLQRAKNRLLSKPPGAWRQDPLPWF